MYFGQEFFSVIFFWIRIYDPYNALFVSTKRFLLVANLDKHDFSRKDACHSFDRSLMTSILIDDEVKWGQKRTTQLNGYNSVFEYCEFQKRNFGKNDQNKNGQKGWK